MDYTRLVIVVLAIATTTISARAEEQIRPSSGSTAAKAAPNTDFVRCLGHERNVYSVVLTPDGRFAVSGGDDPFLIVWNTKDGSEARRILRHTPGQKTGAARDLALSSDGTKVGALAPGQRVQFWDIATGEPAAESYPLDAPTIHWALSHDRTKLARSGSSDVTVTDLSANKVVLSKNFPTNEVNLVHAICFSPDGHSLAMALRNDGRRQAKSDVGKVQVWNVTNDKELFSAWPVLPYVADVAFSPDGKRFAAGSFKLELWNFPEFSSLFSLPLPDAPSRHFPIQCLAFDFTSTRIASGGGDGFVRLWNASDGKLADTLKEPLDAVTALCFSQDGTKLAAGGSNKTVLVWSLSPQQP